MDINALRDRLNALNKKTSRSDDTWKPRDEHQVRLVPNPFDDDPFQELHFHNEIGDNPPILCPKMNYGEECDICDFADVLKAWKGPDGKDKAESARKADWEIFKKIQAKPRVFSLVVERANKEKNIAESEVAKWWSMTVGQVKQALEVCDDGDRLEELGIAKDDTASTLRVLLDPKKGYDLLVSFAKPNDKGNTTGFTQITIKGKIKSSPLAKDEAAAKKLTEGVKRLSEIYPKVTSAEVAKVFKKFMGAGGPSAKPEGGTEKYGKDEKPARPTNSKEDAKVSGTRSIDEAFGDMIADEA